jgi:hypothetical protein
LSSAQAWPLFNRRRLGITIFDVKAFVSLWYKAFHA